MGKGRFGSKWVFIMGILGIGAIITMPDNPFAYIIMAFSILLITPLLIHRKQFQINVKIEPTL